MYYIVPNELAERFCYYGIRPLLRSFFMSSLGYTKDVAMQLYHVFNMVCYFFPLFGAAISDSWLDKYHTIVYLSLIYAAGTVVLSVTSIPNVLGLPPAIPAWGPLLGLALIGIGTGGIKPCVSAHGGDQFLPSQKNGLEKFYSYVACLDNLVRKHNANALLK